MHSLRMNTELRPVIKSAPRTNQLSFNTGLAGVKNAKRHHFNDKKLMSAQNE